MKQLLPFSKTAEHDLRVVSHYGKHSFFLSSGKEIFDAQSGNGAFPLGFENSEIVDFVAEKVKGVPFVRANNATTSQAVLELNEKFKELSNGKYAYVFYGLGGSDSIETALKMALVYWRAKGRSSKKKVISFLHGYHGSTFVSGSATGIRNFHRPLKPLLPLPWTLHADQPRWYGPKSPGEIKEIEENSLLNLENLILNEGAENIAAILKEPFSWQSGVHAPSREYYQQLRAICDRHEILLIVDDICTGAGKLGAYFGSEWMGIDCDISCNAKGISAGFFPLSATFCSKEVGDALYDTHFIHGWTYSPPLAGVFSALKAIEVIQRDDLLNRALAIENKVSACAKKLFDDGLIEGYRAKGVFCGIDIKDELARGKIEKTLWDNGIQLSCYRFDPILRTILALTTSDAEIEALFFKLEKVLEEEIAKLPKAKAINAELGFAS